MKTYMYSVFYLISLSSCFAIKYAPAQFIQCPKKKMSISLLNQCSTSSVCLGGVLKNLCGCVQSRTEVLQRQSNAFSVFSCILVFVNRHDYNHQTDYLSAENFVSS